MSESKNIIKLNDGREVELEAKHYEAIIQEQADKGAAARVSTWRGGHLISMVAIDADLASAMISGMDRQVCRYKKEHGGGNHLGYFYQYRDVHNNMTIKITLSLA
jgi:hypothetical protein